MKKRELIILFFVLSRAISFAQVPSCSNGYVYMDTNPFISVYDPSQPLSANNPSLTNVPMLPGGGGLTVMPNINGGTLTPTFYSVLNSTYYYWSGTTWVNTGHTTGNSSAVNIAGCNGALYNLVGSTGQVYVYNGTGNGTLLTTLAGFNGGGPFDLVTDCNCNFYALNTTTPNQGLSMYNSAGVLQCTYSLTGMPNTSAGGGFAIIGNQIYVKNNTANGFYVGTITGSGVTFTAVTNFTASPGDFASCPVCYAPSGGIATTMTVSNGGTITCTNPSVNIVTSTTGQGMSFFWAGPGISSSVTSNTLSSITATAPGTYSCILTTSTCPPAQNIFTVNIGSSVIPVTVAVTPTGNICSQLNSITPLTATHSSTNATIFWSGPSIPPSPGPSVFLANAFGTYTVKVLDISSGCSASTTVTVHQTPTVNLSLSSATLCQKNYNGSPATMTMTATGATNYTLFTSSNYSVASTNPSIFPIAATSIFGNLSPYATATLVGSTGVCRDTTVSTFTIVPNPFISLSQTSASICPGDSKALSVIGASQYSWSGPPGLNQYTGSNVTAFPSISSVYTVVGTDSGCASVSQTVAVVVLSLPTVSVSPPTSTICLASVVTLTAFGSASSYSWSPSTGIISSVTGPVISASPPSTIVYTVVGSLNTCTSSAIAVVNIVQPPVLSLGLSSPTVCAFNYNGSPNTISCTPGGAYSYTLVSGNNVSVLSPNGPIMQVAPTGTAFSGVSVVSTTLIGKLGVCTTSITKTFSIVPNPTISVTPPSASVCPGHSQAFNVSGAVTYSWLPASSYTLTGPDVIVANPTLTSFFSVVGTDNVCRSETKNAVLVILPVPDISISPSTTTVCAGNSVTLTAFGSSGATYSWSPSLNLSSSAGSVVIATPASFQTYVVKATLNTCTNQAVSSVSVIVVPVLHVSASQPTVCSSDVTILKASGANVFFWYPSKDLDSPSGSAIIARPQESTTYSVHGYNGICTGSTTIFIQTVKWPNMQLTAGASQICRGSYLPISVSGADSYTWMPQTGLIPTGSSTAMVATPLVSTNYTIVGATTMATVSCYQQLSYPVTVIQPVVPLVTDSVAICEGQRTTLSASGGNTFSWTPSFGLNITDGSRVVANPSITTVYTVDISYDSFCGKTATVMVTVNPNPTVFAGNDASYNMNDAIFVTALGTGTLTWVQGEDILCRDCPQTQVYPTRSGCYVVQAVNEEGCSASDDICIELTEDFTLYVPNSFTPNGDGINDQFVFFGENISDATLEIYDRWGAKIFYSADFHTGWDGTFKDALCPVGSYTYVIKYTGLNRKKYTKTGNVNLMK